MPTSRYQDKVPRPTRAPFWKPLRPRTGVFEDLEMIERPG